MSTLSMQIQDYKRSLLIADQLQASLERKASGPTIETEIVDAQLDGVEFDYCTCNEQMRCDLCRKVESEYLDALYHRLTPTKDGACPNCGYEEGRSKADKQYHEENCGVCTACGELDTECAGDCNPRECEICLDEMLESNRGLRRYGDE